MLLLVLVVTRPVEEPQDGSENDQPGNRDHYAADEADTGIVKGCPVEVTTAKADVSARRTRGWCGGQDFPLLSD